MSCEAEARKRVIYRVTFVGFVVNLVLTAMKFAAGIVGRSGAMVADAVHSCSDMATDVVVIAFAKISAKPRDDGHDYGHGKYETLAGIGCAYFLGQRWRIADPIAALVVAVFIFKVAFDLIRTGLGELLERSLPDETEQEILGIVTADPEVGEPHNLRTRRIGAAIAVEVHVRVDGAMSVARSHELTVDIERRLRARFGQGTIISIHVEPVKCPAEAGIPGGDPPSCP